MSALLTIHEAAKELRTSRATLYHYLNDGTVKSVWLVGRRLIERAEIERLIKEGRKLGFQATKELGRRGPTNNRKRKRK